MISSSEAAVTARATALRERTVISMENKNRPEDEVNMIVSEDAEGIEQDVFDDSVQISPDAASDDGELDISELLHKYLPDFAAEGEGVADDTAEDVASDDGEVEELIYSEEYTEEAYAADPDEYTDEELSETGSGDYFEESFVYAEEEEYAEEPAVEPAEEAAEEYPEEEYTPEVEDYSEYEYTSDEAADTAEYVIKKDDGVNIPEDTELDATDINLMVAFGLDDELAATMGADVAQKLTDEIHAEAAFQEEKYRRSVENEFLDFAQVPEITADLKRRISRLKGKIFFAVMLTLVLFIYENLKFFGVQFGSFLNPAVYPVIYIMGSLQVMLFCAAVGYEQILGGCGELFCGRINPSSLAFLGNVAAVVYSVIQAETTVIPNEPVLFNSCAAAMTLFAIICDYIGTRRTMNSFNIVSAKRTKYAVKYMTAAEAGIPGGLFEDDDVSEGGVLRIEKTKFVDDFFSRIYERTKSSKTYSAAYLFISVVIAVAMAVYAGLRGGDGSMSAVSVGFVTFFATMPLSLFLAMSYPFYKGSSDAFDDHGTIIGEGAVEEYAEAGAVCFDDVDAFPSYGVKVQNVKIYNNHRIDRVLYYAASVFKTAGGPLSDVFEMATMETGSSDNVELIAAAEGYLSATVDDKNIIFGSAVKLREYGVNLPDSVILEDDAFSDEVCVMYMLREGKLMAKFILRYMLDADFEFLLKDLSDEGMCACIKTFDPNIDDALVNMKLGGGRYPFRVLRYNDTEEINRISERTSSGIVSRDSTKPLLGIIGSCSKILSTRKACFTVGVVSAVIAAIIVWLLAASGGIATLTSGIVLIYQLLWAVAVVIITKMFLR